MMTPDWPSYFDVLHQYNGINPPQFFGSGMATQNCVDAALRDVNSSGLLSSDTMRSLANCHQDGMDPSPQVILILAPEIHVQQPTLGLAAGVFDLCAPGSKEQGYHFGGLNVPNYAVIPTNPGCASNFAGLVRLIAHEVVETVSDPNGLGMGTVGQNELADNCEKLTTTTSWNDQQLRLYWSNADQGCEPTWSNSQ
ncbi:MAG TPA: hypothetical protein VFY05_00045, partial [Candidatus Angelobacter sp.]|nr:hypothetical protein [Candidatus Angelobacter sp.]